MGKLDRDQELLLEGLMIFGLTKLETLLIMARVWEPEEVREMLEYMVNHRDASPAELLELSSKICSRRKDEDEDGELWVDDAYWENREK